MKKWNAITVKRSLGLWNTWLAFQLTRLSGKVISPPLPFSIAIEPTTACNLRCPECPSGLRSFTRPTGLLSMDLFKKVIDETAPHCAYLTFYFQGEPFLHPEFLQMVSYASSKKIYTLTSSNGHYFTPEVVEEVCKSGLGELIISMDGITQTSYERYRVGGDLEKVIAGIKELRRVRANLGIGPRLLLQFLAMRHTIGEMEEAKRKAEEWGVDRIVFKTVQVYGKTDSNALVPEDLSLSRYARNAEGELTVPNQALNRCWKLWSSAVITWDGKVVPCCFDKDATHIMGDISKESFKAIWLNRKYREFRKKLIRGRKQIDICQNCSEGAQVFMDA